LEYVIIPSSARFALDLCLGPHRNFI
jgi:hypothetical protein